MKIIKAGVVPSITINETFQGRCRLCGCVVECARDEVTAHQEASVTGGHVSPLHYVKCPTEGCIMLIEMKQIVYRSE